MKTRSFAQAASVSSRETASICLYNASPGNDTHKGDLSQQFYGHQLEPVEPPSARFLPTALSTRRVWLNDGRCGGRSVGGTEAMHMLAKGQMKHNGARQTPPSSSIRCRYKRPHHAELVCSAILIATKTIDLPCVRVLSSVAVTSTATRLARPLRQPSTGRIMKRLRKICSDNKQHLVDIVTVVVMFAVLVASFLWL
jgi:hypothetical protein